MLRIREDRERTSVTLPSELKKAIDLKRKSNSDIVEEALMYYLREVNSLDHEIARSRFKVEEEKQKINELEKIKKEVEKEKNRIEEEEESCLEDRDLVDEFIDKMGWSDFNKDKRLERFRDLNGSALEVHADGLGVDVGVLRGALEDYFDGS